MMQRNEAKSRKSFLSVNEDFRSRHSSKQKLSEKLSDNYVSNTSCEKNKKIPEESQNSLNNSGSCKNSLVNINQPLKTINLMHTDTFFTISKVKYRELEEKNLNCLSR